MESIKEFSQSEIKKNKDLINILDKLIYLDKKLENHNLKIHLSQIGSLKII